MMNLQEFQTWFEGRFLAVIEEKGSRFLLASNYQPLQDVLSYITTYAKGGKRFRPYLTYVGYTTEGGENDIFPLLASIELLHLFCLVHDDLIDDTQTRHNTLTLHAHYQSLYKSVVMGRAVALLVGDLLLAWSIECLHDLEPVEPYTIDDANAEYRVLLSEVIHGQMLDVVLSGSEDTAKELIEQKMVLKSAHYSFFRPLYIGMVLAGADPDIKQFAEEYATSLGLAFQLVDDINDAVEDIKTGQQTLIVWYMRNQATVADRERFNQCIDQQWTDEDERKLLNILEQSGAIAFAEEKTEEYFLAAEDAVFNHDRTGEEIWQEIIDEVKDMS
jgi:geranylgeranyl diphosphate synthase type I